jgi:allantoinase
MAFDTKNRRYGFSMMNTRAPYRWPNGSGLAVYVALNVEAFQFGLNPGPDFTTMPSAPFHRGFAYRDYGNRVGISRIHDAFAEADAPLAILANLSVYDACPEILEPFRKRGDEIVGHGRTNSERQVDMAEADERKMLQEVRERMLREEGRAPSGWLGPFISQSAKTPELLVEAGFSYMLDWWFDDQPQSFETDKGPIIAVPYPSMEMNDIPALINRGMSDADFERMLFAAFDQQLLESQKTPQVYAVSIHTFLMGQPHRVGILKRLLRHIASHAKDVWFTTPGRIAEHASTVLKPPINA